MSERVHSVLVAGCLLRLGWDVELEYRTPAGFIDILARRDDETRIIEVKATVCYEYDARKLLEQLRRYAQFFPDASLWFTPQIKVKSPAVEFLKSYDVHLLTKEEIEFDKFTRSKLGRAINLYDAMSWEECDLLVEYAKTQKSWFERCRKQTQRKIAVA